jgi:hypothetical protein
MHVPARLVMMVMVMRRRILRLVQMLVRVPELIAVLVIVRREAACRRSRMGMRMLVTVPMLLLVLIVMMLMLMAMPVIVVMPMIVRMFLLLVAVLAVLPMRMRRTRMNTERDALHIEPVLPFEVHVKVADLELAQLPLERRRLHAEVAQSAHGHVAADAGETVEIEDFHVRKNVHD